MINRMLRVPALLASAGVVVPACGNDDADDTTAPAERTSDGLIGWGVSRSRGRLCGKAQNGSASARLGCSRSRRRRPQW